MTAGRHILWGLKFFGRGDEYPETKNGERSMRMMECSPFSMGI